MMMSVIPISSVGNNKINIETIYIKFLEEETRLVINTDIETDSTSRITFNIGCYGLEEEYILQNSYTYSANSFGYYISLPIITSKTLIEIEAYNVLYPELKSNYNFILFPCGDINNNQSINPIKIDYKNDVMYYENFEFENIEKVAEYTVLSSRNIPNLKGIKKGNVEVYVDIPIRGQESDNNYYLLSSTFDENGIHIKDYYYDYRNNELCLDNGFKVNEVNFPVESFSLKIKFTDLGESRSNFEIVREYKNTKKVFGECEVSSFCFI